MKSQVRNSERLKLAVWNYPPADFLTFGFTSGAIETPFDIRRGDPLLCAAWLKEGEVDIALIPTLTMLREYEDLLLIPEIGLSATFYPYARLLVRTPLNEVKRVAFDPRAAQEVMMARLVLKEHYSVHPEFKPYAKITVSEALHENDAVLLVGSDIPTVPTDVLSLDVGQEWYELTTYPMVWGVFAGHVDRITVEAARALQNGVRAAEQHMDLWLQSQESPAIVRSFFENSFQSELDLFALGGLDMFAHQMFYTGVLAEVPELPFFVIPDPDDNGENSADAAP